MGYVTVEININLIESENLADIMDVLSVGALFDAFAGFNYLIVRYPSIISAFAHVLEAECIQYLGKVSIHCSLDYIPSKAEKEEGFDKSKLLS